MAPNTRKYYVMVPAAFSHNGNFYWQKLLEVKTLTTAQHYVGRIFGGLTEAEIWVSGNGEVMKLVSKKNTKGKWEVLYGGRQNADERDNSHYHLRGHRVSKEDFYKYGFPHQIVFTIKPLTKHSHQLP